jgi:hypothetical protein
MAKIGTTLVGMIRFLIIVVLAIVVILLLMSLRGCFFIPFLPPMLQCPVWVGPMISGPQPINPHPGGPPPINPAPGTKKTFNPGSESNLKTAYVLPVLLPTQ